MPGVSESFFASTSFTLVAAAVAFLAAVVLLSLMFRLTFGRRLRLPRNGRARVPRLGTVDAFDLDRQRQLVIIRRDNVEHLLMIGGPNDLVIELQIIRAESRDFRESRIRDKDMREPRDAPSLPAGGAWPSPAEAPSPYQPQRKMPFPSGVVEPETGVSDNVHIEEPVPGLASPTVSAASRPPAFLKPPRRVSPPVVPSGQRTPILREPLRGRADSEQRTEPNNGPAKEFRRASVATPFLRSKTAEGTAVRLAPANDAPDVPTEIPTTPSSHPLIEEVPAPPDVDVAPEAGHAMSKRAPADPPIAASDSFEEGPGAVPAPDRDGTLEAEMAKLLGRG